MCTETTQIWGKAFPDRIRVLSWNASFFPSVLFESSPPPDYKLACKSACSTALLNKILPTAIAAQPRNGIRAVQSVVHFLE
jgi:hypothetical protein